MTEVSHMSRRQALKAGVVVGAWTIPAVTVMGAGAAYADSASLPGPNPTGTSTPKPTSTSTSTPTSTSTTNPTSTSTTTSTTTATATEEPSVLPTRITQTTTAPPGGGSSGGPNPRGQAPAVLGSRLASLPQTGSEMFAYGAVGTALVAGGVAAVRAAREPKPETDIDLD